MTFVTAYSNRTQLNSLTKLLVSAFPGSTVYQHLDLLRVPYDVLHNKVDAVFLHAEMGKANGLDLIQMLHRQKPELSVYVVSDTDNLRENAAKAGAKGFFVLPEGKQQLLEAIRLSKKENKNDD